MSKSKIIMIFIVFTFSSCVTVNTTKNQEQPICKLHNKKMQKTLVSTSYGFVCNEDYTLEYKNAKSSKCMGCVKPNWPKQRLAIIYHC